ncbi:MAG TPA: hypothetical protein VN611_03210 [Patescibacteria group bacterium]|nr:hypothetical protein [Patescibacteria group bacterium]
MNIDRLTQITALTGGDYGANAELERLQERRGALLQKLQDTAREDTTGTPAAAVSIKDIAKDLKEVDRRYLETQLEEQTRQIEAEGQKNLQEIARKQRQREAQQKKAGERAGVIFSGSLTKLVAADNRAGSLSALKEPSPNAMPTSATTAAAPSGQTKSPAAALAAQESVYDSREAYEGRRFMRWVEHENHIVNEDVKSSVELGIAEAETARRAQREKIKEAERERLGLTKKKGFGLPGLNIQA